MRRSVSGFVPGTKDNGETSPLHSLHGFWRTNGASLCKRLFSTAAKVPRAIDSSQARADSAALS